MIVVKDAMVLIHLAKTSLLGTSCEYFEDVVIPEKIQEETVGEGKRKNYPDAVLIKELIKEGKITTVDIQEKELIERAKKFNIQGGEAEALALYWERDADFLATDDDNVRSKKTILGINIIGTLSILIKLFKADKVDRERIAESLETLKDVGWFSAAVLDKVRMEVGIR